LLRMWLMSSPRTRQRLVEQIEKEWRAQIEHVMEVCAPRPIQALDGHMHVHMLPFMFPIAARLASEFGIPEIRITDELFHFAEDWRASLDLEFAVNVIKHLVLRACSIPARKIRREYDLVGPDTMIGVLYTGRMTASSGRRGIRVALAKRLREVEVLFHIGRGHEQEAKRWQSCPDIGRFYLSDKRDTEFAELIALRETLV